MAFLDKVFRWKKKPFGKGEKKEITQVSKAAKAVKEAEISEKGSGKLAHILLCPHLSEKAVDSASRNQYIFEVAGSAGKKEVENAVYDLYRVRPESVNVINVRGKHTRFGKTAGQTKKWKKAIITLPAGKSIEVYKK